MIKKILDKYKNKYKVFVTNKLFVSSFILLFVGSAMGFFLSKISYEKTCDTTKYKYINQQLECGQPQVVDKRSYNQLKNQLEKVISEKTENGEVIDISIYFRDLQYGPTFGIGEHEKFSPASLLKLPLLLTYLIYFEGDPNFFETRIVVPPSKNRLEQAIPPKYSVKENTQYSISEMLEFMIKYSDNASYYTLLDYLKQISPQKDLLKETFVDLGIVDPLIFEDETISVKSYASIFVQLYHSSFLQNKELSERALNLLADTDFTQGIVAGVPGDIKVAHKFGERFGIGEDFKQLHDCGIVYYPNNPYVICIMTKGKDTKKLSEVIASISKIVYQEFDSRKL